MLISVIVCTCNRAPLLKLALERMALLQNDEGFGWELVVVNNNSTDNTDQTIRSFSGRLPVRSVFESEPGLSNARNRGLVEASGDYLVWTDDDVRVSERWLSSYATMFRAHPEAAVFGGPIRPFFEGEPPDWLKAGWLTIASAFATRDFGPEVKNLSDELVPFGANFAIRRDVQLHYLYDPLLGRSPTSTFGGEETAVIRAILRDGHTGWWVPDAPVQHRIPTERQNLDYLKTYYFEQGIQVGILSRSSGGTAAFFCHLPALLAKTITREVMYRLKRLAASPEVWLADFKASNRHWGHLSTYKQRHGRKVVS